MTSTKKPPPARSRGRGALLGAPFLALALAAGACATGQLPDAARAPDAALDCPPIAAAEPLLAPGRVVLLGEMHGTAESPAFVAALACRALDAGRPVTVALEIPLQEGGRVEGFLGSAGAEVDRAALLGSEFWQGGYQDGRRSAAKLALLERLRELRGRGLPLEVVLLDDATVTGGKERDRRMAERLVAAAEESPDGVVITLTGNLHNRVVRGLPWDPEHESMGYLAAQRLGEERIASLDVSSAGGTAWFCTGSTPATCGVQSISGRGAADSPVAVELYPEPDETGYHGVYQVGTLTASPPAVEGPAPEAGAGER